MTMKKFHQKTQDEIIGLFFFKNYKLIVSEIERWLHEC